VFEAACFEFNECNCCGFSCYCLYSGDFGRGYGCIRYLVRIYVDLGDLIAVTAGPRNDGIYCS